MPLFYGMSALGLILFAGIVEVSIIAMSVVAIVAILARARVEVEKAKNSGCECIELVEETPVNLNEGRTGDV